MAIELGTAYISVVPETSKLADGIKGQLKQSESQADSAGRGVGSKFSAGFKAAAVGVAVAGGAALAGAAVGLKAAVGEASNLGESINAVNVVFGEASEGVLQLGRDAARSVGLSQSQFNGLAVQFSSFAQTVAGEGGDVSSTLDDLTTRAADFASVMNLDVADAAAIFQSGLAGESEPLRQYGIDLSAAAVEAFAAANGIGTLGEQLSESEKVTARYGLLMQETAVAQGDFANTSDSLANRQRILGATLDDIKARIGEALLPVMERLFGFVLDTGIPAVESIISGFQSGGEGSDELGGKMAGLGSTLRTVFDFLRDEVYPRLVTFRDFVRDEVVPRIQDFAGFIRDDLVPQLKEIRDRFQQDVMPRLREVADYLKATFQPTFESLVALYNQKLKPAIDKITEAFNENRPALEKVAEVVGKVAGVVFYLYTQYLSFLYPALVTIAGYLVDVVVGAFTKTLDAITFVVDSVTDLYEGFQTARDNVGNFIDKIREIELPKSLRDIADIIERISNGVGGVAGRVGGFVRDRVGDVAGSFRGTVIGGGGAGTALATVRSVLPAGLRITSTYRDPAHNARVGGSPTSKHMDRANPAVDIAGPVGLMDGFARVLAQLPHRQLLYRTAGHFDHIHFAHTGGTVDSSWGSIPGLRSDERPVITQVGERILSRSEAADYNERGGASITVNADSAVLRTYGLSIARQAMREARISQARSLAAVMP